MESESEDRFTRSAGGLGIDPQYLSHSYLDRIMPYENENVEDTEEESDISDDSDESNTSDNAFLNELIEDRNNHQGLRGRQRQSIISTPTGAEANPFANQYIAEMQSSAIRDRWQNNYNHFVDDHHNNFEMPASQIDQDRRYYYNNRTR